MRFRRRFPLVSITARQRDTLCRLRAGLPTALRAELPAKRVAWLYAALILSLIVMSVFAALFDRFPGDVWLTRQVQSVDVPGLERAERVATHITNPTNSILALVIAVTALIALRQPRLALFAVTALSAHALGALLKFVVDRDRPDPRLVEVVRIEERFSYPSGHVEWVVAFEGLILFAIWQLVRNRLVRWIAVGVWVTHLALTSAGRVDQGLHWPSDVVASYLVGATALLAVIWLYRVSLRLIPPTSAGTPTSRQPPGEHLLQPDDRGREPDSGGNRRI